MSATDLLLWMSARSSGSWSQFRAAVERYVAEPASSDDDEDGGEEDSTDTRLPQTLKFNFEGLGYAEFNRAAGDKEWRIAPPVLIIAQRGDRHRGFLTGARSDLLLRRIDDTFAPEHVGVESQESSPDSIFLEAEGAAVLPRLAAAAGLVSQHGAPTAILAALSALTPKVFGRPTDLPLGKGWTFERFREHALRWESSNRAEIERTQFGLFRLRFRYRTEAWIRWAGRAHRTTFQEGKYLALKRARKNVLAYDHESASLSLPLICRPPTLIDRALILSSGRLPRLENRETTAFLHYPEVEPSVARTAASLLRQGLS